MAFVEGLLLFVVVETTFPWGKLFSSREFPFSSWNEENLSEGTALDLVAVLTAGELLVVGLVLAGHESFGHPEGRALLKTNIGSETSDLASDSLHAFFALDNSGVDVIDTLDNIGHRIHIIVSMTLPSHTREGDKGGEEEGETSQNKDTNDDGGEVGEGLFFLVGYLTIRVRGGTISCGRGAVRGGGGSIRGCGFFVGLGGGTIA